MLLHDILLYIFTAVFAIGVLLNTLGPKGIKNSYIRWGLSANFRFLTALLELVALALIWFGYPLPGYLAALVVMTGSVFILFRSKEYKPIVAPFVTIVIILFLM